MVSPQLEGVEAREALDAVSSHHRSLRRSLWLTIYPPTIASGRVGRIKQLVDIYPSYLVVSVACSRVCSTAFAFVQRSLTSAPRSLPDLRSPAHACASTLFLVRLGSLVCWRSTGTVTVPNLRRVRSLTVDTELFCLLVLLSCMSSCTYNTVQHLLGLRSSLPHAQRLCSFVSVLLWISDEARLSDCLVRYQRALGRRYHLTYDRCPIAGYLLTNVDQRWSSA